MIPGEEINPGMEISDFFIHLHPEIYIYNLHQYDTADKPESRCRFKRI